MNEIHDHCDPYNLNRYVEAQEDDYERALSEIRNGHKRSHWMWYIFPQYDGLGLSSTSKRFAIKSVAEAAAYRNHHVLGPRLLECCESVVRIEDLSATEIFGSPDDMKLRSCATLFAAVSPPGSVFEQVLDKFFGGVRDDKTIRLMNTRAGTALETAEPPGEPDDR